MRHEPARGQDVLEVAATAKITAAKIAATEVTTTELASAKVATEVAAGVAGGPAISRVAAGVGLIGAFVAARFAAAGRSLVLSGVIKEGVGDSRPDHDAGEATQEGTANQTTHANTTTGWREAAKAALKGTGIAHLGAGRGSGERSRIVSGRGGGSPLVFGQILSQLLEDHLTLLRRQSRERFSVRLLDSLGGSSLQEIPIALDRPRILILWGVASETARLAWGFVRWLAVATAQEPIDKGHVSTSMLDCVIEMCGRHRLWRRLSPRQEVQGARSADDA